MTDDLLALADFLARRDPGRPKQVLLRKAVSAAYYALFHALAQLCADELVGRKPWNVFTPVYRSLDHGSAKRLFERSRAAKSFGPVVIRIGHIFNVLQEHRHDADYNPEPFPFKRQDTLILIDQAREAIDALSQLSRDARLLLAVHLIARPR